MQQQRLAPYSHMEGLPFSTVTGAPSTIFAAAGVLDLSWSALPANFEALILNAMAAAGRNALTSQSAHLYR